LLQTRTVTTRTRSDPVSGSTRPAFARDRLPETQAIVHALLAAVGLVLLSPLFLLLAAAIKLSTPGPVFYRGDRVGRDGRIFSIYKFRTLAVGAEQKIGARLLTPEERRLYGGRLGPLLKKSKLDELPQLLNVIRGEMRLVGPRPIRPALREAYEGSIRGYRRRFAVPPGITGIAQLRGGYYTPERQKLRYDLAYIRRRSLLLDVGLVLLTFVKIAERSLNAGLVALFVFFFVSFVPASLYSALAVPIFGRRVDVILLVILAGVVVAAAKHDWSRFSIRRGPLNVGLVLFLGAGLVSALLSDDPAATLHVVGYYAVSGFFVAFLLVNSFQSERFSGVITRTIALTSVAISAIGLLEIWLVSAGVRPAFAAYGSAASGESLRMDALIGNPVSLSIYLLLGIPLLFSEISRSAGRGQRDAWIVFATISVIGIVFTQTRVGLVALLATGAFFFCRHRSRALAFVALFTVGVAALVLAGAPRFSPSIVAAEIGGWLDHTTAVLASVSLREWIFGGDLEAIRWLARDGALEGPKAGDVTNMHVTLARELGIVTWLVWAGVVVAVVRRLLRAHRRARTDAQRTQLWAILSSLAGFLVAMTGLNAFHHLSLQVYFWSLIGIGLGTANQIERAGGRNLIWRFGDAGD
jgi:lipopolysaccharide/colanic/teichoic acid biosynthesis glycosyltransferase